MERKRANISIKRLELGGALEGVVFPQVPFGLFVSEQGNHVHTLTLDVLQGEHICLDEFL